MRKRRWWPTPTGSFELAVTHDELLEDLDPDWLAYRDRAGATVTPIRPTRTAARDTEEVA